MSYYIKKFWRINAIAAAFQIALYGVRAVLNLLQMQAFQGVIEKDFQRFLYWILITLAGWMLFFVIQSVQIYFQGLAVRRMNNQLRYDLSATLLKKNHREYHAKDKGEYLSEYTNNVSQIQKLAWEPFFDMIGLIAQVCWSMLALASLHWSLLVVSLLSGCVMMLFPRLFESKMERMGQECQTAQAQAASRLKDLLSGYDVLRFFGCSNRFHRQSGEASEQMEKTAFRRNTIDGVFGGILGAVVMVCQVGINMWIAFLSIHGTIIQSALFGGGNLCGAISNGLNDIADRRLSFASARPYFAMIAVHADDSFMNESGKIEPLRDCIALEQISFSYGQKPVLKDRSMCFEKNKKYALTGASGCGKSTLLKILLGWLPEYSGTIYFDGKDIREYTPEQLQQQMSYIEQDVFLFNTTIRENITLGESFTGEQMQRALRDSALADDLAVMPDGLDTIVGEEGSALSGGQRQRVAIARALIHNRSILLVDEGTSALDQKNADVVEKSLLSNPDLTLILISHHLMPERKAQFDYVYEL